VGEAARSHSRHDTALAWLPVQVVLATTSVVDAPIEVKTADHWGT